MNSWKDALVAYFLQGSKPNRCATLGVEVEHFILESQTQQAVSYYGDHGIAFVLHQLMSRYPQAEILPDEAFFGFTTPEFTITLEPAAQLEVSVAPQKSVRDIGVIYARFRQKLDAILSPLGYAAYTVGCQPVSPVAELKMIPKTRYALMHDYFRHTGTGGMEMMRGTASVQVSVDYSSEADFRRKIQAAYFYSPFLKLLCDHSLFFQGKPLTSPLKRTDIWRRVDAARCGILPGVFSPSYGFAAYADFLGAMPPIFMKQNGHIVPTGAHTTAQLLAARTLTQPELVHLLSMAFPDVRLKQFLEIRVADSMPLPFLLAYCALIKGLLYSQQGLDYAQQQIKQYHLSEAKLSAAEDALMRQGWKAELYQHPVQAGVKNILALAQRNLPTQEQVFLQAFNPVVTYGGIAHIPANIYRNLEQQTYATLEPVL